VRYVVYVNPRCENGKNLYPLGRKKKKKEKAGHK
jgi:hypothetical protein